MKKTLLLLSLSTLLSSSLAFAQEENLNDQFKVVPPTVIKVTNDSSTQHAIWVTIYNSIGRISDTACVVPSKVVEFNGYMPPFVYGIRTEVKANMDCSGETIGDIEWDLPMPIPFGLDVDVYKENGDFTMRLK